MADQGLMLDVKPSRSGGRKTGVLVVAIDFGTTYSGYAYSFKSDFDENPLQVYANNFVTGESDPSEQLMYPKVPTTVLFSPEKNFHSFGFEAQDKYAALCKENSRDAKTWFYFENFKMTLHKNKTMTRDMPLMDFTHRKSMPVIDVFAASIRFLKDHLTKTLVSRRCPVKEGEISWVLTVPAIWGDQARQFMREAAEKAGIPKEQLELALEPESASVFCQQYFSSLNNTSSSVDLQSQGQRFLVVDCGGGTIDLTVYEVQAGSRLKELYRPTGGAWGGTKVDEAFKTFLYDVAGFDAVTSFDRMEMLELYREFEQVKRTPTFSDNVSIKLPESIKQSMTENWNLKEEFTGKVQLLRGRLLIDRDIMESFFTEPCAKIVGDIENVLNQEVTRGVNTILLVGGFSESTLVQHAVRQAYTRYKVLVPDNPAAAVLKGAVLYRHCPDVIGWRASALTYGISVTRFFNEVEDLQEKLLVMDGTHYCKDVFKKFITVNESVRVDQKFPVQSFNPLYSGQTHMVVEVFASHAENPRYTTSSGCFKVGEARVDMQDLRGDRNRQVHVTMLVGGTELKVEARDGNTGEVFTAVLDFLSTV